MKISVGVLLKGSAWTIGAYGFGQVLRMGTNVVLARLLAPELFGIMLIVNSLRTGITLISDFGVGQNIVYNKEANNPEFYNTARTMEIIRSVLLFVVCLAVAIPLSRFYRSPILVWILPVSALSFVTSGFSSVSRFLVQKRMEVAKLNMFEMIVAFISSVGYIQFAYFSPNIWSLVLGGVFGSVVSMIGSYYLLPYTRQKLYISKRYARQILGFGKWIFVSSIVYFLSMNYDRLYLPKLLSFDVLGVYGVARSIAELIGILTLRLGNIVLFPFIASHAQMARSDLHLQLASIRAKSFLAVAIGISILVAISDVAIKILYDHRYQDAGWMLPLLILGSWFSVLASVNDSTLLGLGKPSYSAMANSTKFAFLAIGLPLGFAVSGVLGVVIVFALADLCRYVPIFMGQYRERFSFGRQDLVLSLALLGLTAFWQWLRWVLGFGTSFDKVF